MRIGFTGTQLGMTEAQLKAVAAFVRFLNVTEAHHGDCIGADAQFHGIIRDLFPGAMIYIHPCGITSKRAHCKGDVTHPVLPPLERNRIIVDSSELMLATPKSEAEEMRSGTWATIRYTRKIKQGCVIFDPDGSLK